MALTIVFRATERLKSLSLILILIFQQEGCSVSSADIEQCYQQNQATMTFTVNGDTYTLDIASM